MTKIFSLVFDYNITKMQQTGRPWANIAYKNKSGDIIDLSFSERYSELDKNPISI